MEALAVAFGEARPGGLEAGVPGHQRAVVVGAEVMHVLDDEGVFGGVGDLTDQEAVAEEQEVHTGTFGAMAARFDGAQGAFAYLLFILLYTPCTAALAAVYQESGTRWMLFVGGWTFGLAYGLATLWYQIANFGRLAVLAAKESVNRAFESGLSDGVMFERRLFHSLFATADQKEGMDAFLGKREAKFTHR